MNPRELAALAIHAVFATELLRVDVAARAGIDLGFAAGGDRVTWALSIDAVTVARTDEAMTDQAAQQWARRVLGEGVTFLPGHAHGGFYVAGPAVGAHPERPIKNTEIDEISDGGARAGVRWGRWAR